ncbi:MULTISPECIES: arylesterase [unclassified Methylophaga]|jgi:acyl-CoA thioesterase-1|uniref:arylesterase n=4 Tax=Methylophaga TaxID=40222 RepID=UPI00259D0CD0|nr:MULTISPECIES: arylesterase [unclassified Methylophaga]|tara:strand:+ start:1770 stop:2393 length:624 start_codon:yes stop_codon:yes gene_type:complete
MFLKRQYWFVLLISLLMSNAVSASTLLVMGDSLSAAHNLRPELGWVSLLENQLSESHPEISVVNASVSGETTQGGLARFKQLLSEHKPSWVILELGANDALRGYPLTQTKQNLESMIEQAHKADAKVLLVGNQIPQNYGKRYTEMFFNLYKELAEQYQLAYVPFMLKGVALDKTLMQADGLHPNKEGQPVVLQNIKPALLPLLDEAK